MDGSNLRVSAIVLLFVVGSAIFPASGAALQIHASDSTQTIPESQTNTTASPTNNTSNLPPGALLSGVIGVQKAELHGTFKQYVYRQQLEKVASNTSKAATVSHTVDQVQSRLQDTNATLSELRKRYQNGTISMTKYRVRIAELQAVIQAQAELLRLTKQTAQQLPQETLEDRKVNLATIEKLKISARNLSESGYADIPPVDSPGKENGAPNNGSSPPPVTPGNESAEAKGPNTGPPDDVSNGEPENATGQPSEGNLTPKQPTSTPPRSPDDSPRSEPGQAPHTTTVDTPEEHNQTDNGRATATPENPGTTNRTRGSADGNSTQDGGEPPSGGGLRVAPR